MATDRRRCLWYGCKRDRYTHPTGWISAYCESHLMLALQRAFGYTEDPLQIAKALGKM